MMSFFNTLFASLQAMVMPLWTKLKLWTSPTYWRTEGISQLRKFFSKVFRIRPKDSSDYYSVFNWLVSKRLAFAAVVVIGVLGLYYILIMSPFALASGDAGKTSIRTYKYNSIPLKYMSGTVRILAEDRYIAYEGEVKDGFAEGGGMLFDPEGALIYQGQFAKSMYNGAGRLYYPNETLRYDGAFTDNVFNGQGNYFFPSGTLEYTGSFVNGWRTGFGTLYNEGGNPIFAGNFLMDDIVFSEFLGKSTGETSSMYTGTSKIYSSDSEYCIEMSEINGIISVGNGANTLDEEWPVSRVTIVRGDIRLGGAVIDTINGLTAYFGEPNYFGTTLPDLSDSVALLFLDSKEMGLPVVTMSESFDNVYTVTGYDQDFEIYIYVYIKDGLVYTFFSPTGGTPGFLMYSIEMA